MTTARRGLQPRASSLSTYRGMYVAEPEAPPYLKALGKYKTGKGCLDINKPEVLDMAALEKLIKTGVANMWKTAKAKGWPISPA